MKIFWDIILLEVQKDPIARLVRNRRRRSGRAHAFIIVRSSRLTAPRRHLAVDTPKRLDFYTNSELV